MAPSCPRARPPRSASMRPCSAPIWGRERHAQRQRHRWLVRQRAGPARPLLVGDGRRGPLHAGPQRRRQDHLAQGDHGAHTPPLRLDPPRRRRTDQPAGPRDPEAGHRLRAPGPPPVRGAYRGREPGDRPDGAGTWPRDAGAGARPVPHSAGAAEPAIRHALRRRAADAGDRAGAVRGAQGAAARRAHRGPDAGHDRRHPRLRAPVARAARRHRPGGAARRCGAAGGRPGGLHRERPHSRSSGRGDAARRPHAGAPLRGRGAATMIRRATALAAAASALVPLLALLATAALAHGGDRAFVLLLPTGYYLVGGTLAVAATFLLLALMPKGISDRLAGARVPLLTLRPPSPILTSLLSFLFLAFLLAAGLYGSRDPLANPLPLTIWTLWWVGFTLATALLGNVWSYVNPWTGAYRLAMRLAGQMKPLLGYPPWFG